MKTDQAYKWLLTLIFFLCEFPKKEKTLIRSLVALKSLSEGVLKCQ